MIIQGDCTVAATREVVAAALADPDALRVALPGVQRFEVADDGRYAVTIEAGVGPVKGSFDGVFSIASGADPSSFDVQITASGAQGGAEARAAVTLSDGADGETVAAYEADASLNGRVAAVGQRMLAAVVRRMVEDFFGALVAPPPAPAEAAGDVTEVADAGDSRGAPRRVAVGGRSAALPFGQLDAVSLQLGFVMAIVAVALGRRLAR